MEWVRTTMGEGGRKVIPAEFRKALGLKAGYVVLVGMENNELHVLTAAEAIRRDQEWVRSFVPPGHSLVDELLEERRQSGA